MQDERCSVENPLELPHVDAIHSDTYSSEDSVTIVYATDDQSVDQGKWSENDESMRQLSEPDRPEIFIIELYTILAECCNEDGDRR